MLRLQVFWAYLMWSQFLVIWYGNLPEETGFVFSRVWGAWRPIGGAVFAGMFVIPFVGLIGVAPKKSRLTLGLFATVSLLALWLERYLMVMPSVTAEHGPVVRPAGAGADARLPRPLPALLRALRADLPDGLAAAGRDHPRSRGASLPGADTWASTRRRPSGLRELRQTMSRDKHPH